MSRIEGREKILEKRKKDDSTLDTAMSRLSVPNEEEVDSFGDLLRHADSKNTGDRC